MQYFPVLTLTKQATAAVAAHRFVDYGGAQAILNSNALGVARTAAVAGEYFAIDVLGTAIVEAGAAIAVNDSVTPNADGKAIKKISSYPICGVALKAASADGDLIEVLLIANAK